MSTEQKDLEQNVLASRLSRGWSNFKQGKLISYKMMALILVVAAGLGLWWYIASERKKDSSRRWVEFDEATSAEKLEELAKRYPNTPLASYSLLNVARGQLGPDGIDILNSTRTEQRPVAVENIEKARKGFGELVGQFGDDLVGRAECYLGLAKAEMALVAVPVKTDQPAGPDPQAVGEFRGQVPKVVEYLDELAKLAAPDTPMAKDSKKLADALRNEQAPDPKDRLPAEEFKRIQRALYELRGPHMGRPGAAGGPLSPGGPFPPITAIPGGK